MVLLNKLLTYAERPVGSIPTTSVFIKSFIDNYFIDKLSSSSQYKNLIFRLIVYGFSFI